MLARLATPAAIVLAVLTVVGLGGIVVLRGSSPDNDLAAVRDRLHAGDRVRVAGRVGDVLTLPDGVTAFTLTDDSTGDTPLLVLSRDPASAGAAGRKVTVKGTMQRFEPIALAARYHADFSDTRLARYAGQDVVVADSLGAKSTRNDRPRS